MLAGSFRRWIIVLSTMAAIAAAVTAPAVFGLISLYYEANALQVRALSDSASVSKYIFRHGKMWRFHRVRLAELVEHPELDNDAGQVRIFDQTDTLVLEQGPTLVIPTLIRTAPIIVDGTIVGRVEIERSVEALLNKTLMIGIVSTLLAFFILFAFRKLPLSLLDRTLATLVQREEELETQNFRFEAALANMPQGLCMFDSEKRLLVSNARYAEIYGLDPKQLNVGTPLRSILDWRVASGNCPNDGQQYINQCLAGIARSAAYVAVNELQNGKFIEVLHQPMAGGGWVGIHNDVTQQKHSEEKISHMAHHDALTDLPNRVLLRERLDHHLSGVQRGASLAVLCLDLDHFKQVNDTLGHPVGDALLRVVGERLLDCVRDTDVVARLGGDEFAIIQTGVEQPTSASVLAQRLVEALARPFDADGHEVVIGTSVGISVAPIDSMDADILLRNADMALYRAKEAGRNGYSFFEVGMDAKMHQRRALELDLRKAIEVGGFELFYQPLVNLERNEISGFEALLRWNHPTLGMVLPATFIQLAEETGLIVPLGEWVMRQACAEAAKWPDHIKVAVNLSPVQFRNKSLVSMATSAIANAGIAANRLELEITETTMLQNSEQTLAILHMLRDMGIRISMDDFGTGYSSLSYIRSFPFDKIKIDQSFVRDLDKSVEAIAIVQAVSGLARRLGMTTTAEGVETNDQLEQIRAQGCTEVQGYLFSKPQPASEVPRLLSSLWKKCPAAA